MKFSLLGKKAALRAVGLLEKDLYTPATGDSGRLHSRDSENPKALATEGFGSTQKQLDWDSSDMSGSMPVGAGQSKAASNEFSEPLINRSVMGTNYSDKVPGDALNLPTGSLVGLRTIPGLGVTEVDKVDRAFRFNDQNDGVRVMEGAGMGVPDGPQF